MLKNKIIKRISISTAALFTLLFIYILPNNVSNINIEKEVKYVNSKYKTMNIYLLDKNNRLGRTNVIITSENKEDLIHELLDILISGGIGESLIPSGFKTFIPSETIINNIKITNNLVSIDFSSDLLDVNQDKEELVIESIIYSLTEIDGIDGVIIYIDNNKLDVLNKSNISLPPILTRDFGINKVYDLTSLNNVNHITTYYISKNNDEYYYVPVTKYVNDNREKIEIVIDELTSNNIYNTNLMSFLNSNTEVLEVQKENDILELTFNSYILNDFDKKNILEEVLYSICLSIKDNYNVEEVIFTVENEKIYKSVLKTIE